MGKAWDEYLDPMRRVVIATALTETPPNIPPHQLRDLQHTIQRYLFSTPDQDRITTFPLLSKPLQDRKEEYAKAAKDHPALLRDVRPRHKAASFDSSAE